MTPTSNVNHCACQSVVWFEFEASESNFKAASAQHSLSSYSAHTAETLYDLDMSQHVVFGQNSDCNRDVCEAKTMVLLN